MEDTAQQTDRVRLVRLRKVVAAQDRPGHLCVPAAGAGGGRLRGEPHLGRGVAAGVLPGVVAVDVREGGQGILAGPPGQGGSAPVGEFLQSEQGDLCPEVLGVPQVRVQTRDLDIEPPGEGRDRDLVEADLVSQFGSRLCQALRGQSYTCHTLPLPLP